MAQGNQRQDRLDPAQPPERLNLTPGVNGCGHCGTGFVVVQGDFNGEWLVCLNCSSQRDLKLVEVVA